MKILEHAKIKATCLGAFDPAFEFHLKPWGLQNALRFHFIFLIKSKRI